MELKRMRIASFIFLFIFLLGVISADFEVGNASHNIETNYNPDEKISGWVNISLENEPADSLFTDSNNNSISLLNLLSENEGLEYDCNIAGCASDYKTEGLSKKSINFSLNIEQEKIIGFVLKGKIKAITSLSFTLKSDAEPSCSSQFEIDILNDNSVEFINNKKYSIADSCNSLLTRGCFNSSKELEQYKIGKFPSKHCQRILLPPSPSFKVGAWVNNQTGDARGLKMGLYNLNMEEIEGINCDLPLVSGSQNTSCIIDYLIKEPTAYYVCIYSERDGDLKLRGYSDPISGCGFYQESERNPDENAAFEIFAQGMGFDSVGEIFISDSSEDTMNHIKDYIELTYKTDECPEEGCIIPIKVFSQKSQKINISNLKVEYTTNLGGTEIGEIYSIKKIAPKINAPFQKIFLEFGNFSVPSEYGNKTFNLNLNEKKVFSQKIEIKNFPKITGIYPTTVPSMVPVNFTVLVSSVKNITSYSWSFNDSTTIQKTLINKTTHTYPASKRYYLTVDVQDSEGLTSSKTFEVLAIIPKEEITSEIERKIDLLEGIKIQISSFDEFTQRVLTPALEVSDSEKKLKDIQREHEFASTEEDYLNIITNLSLIEVPELIAITTKIQNLPFYPMEDKIDLEILKEIGGGTYSTKQRNIYRNAIIGWQIENMKTSVSMNRFSAVIDGETRHILTQIKINVEKNQPDQKVYLFLKQMKDLEFKDKTNYFGKESGGYTYWILDENTKEIEFTTSEIIEYEELPTFLSPEINSLLIEEENITPIAENIRTRVKIISISLFFLLLAAFIAYTFLSVWYKRKYETYLFKNRNDLYNLISYVDIAKKKGEGEEQMKNNLKQSGWTGEQVTYVLKKYSGKRTGMIELPLTRFIDKLLNKKEKPKQQIQGANPLRKPF